MMQRKWIPLVVLFALLNTFIFYNRTGPTPSPPVDDGHNHGGSDGDTEVPVPFDPDTTPTIEHNDDHDSGPVERNPLIGSRGCNRTYVYQFAGDWGFGSELNNFYCCVVYAARADRTLVIDGVSWNYGPYYELFENVLPSCQPVKTVQAPHTFDISNAEESMESIWTRRNWDGMWGYFQRGNNSIPIEEMRNVAQRLFVLKPEIVERVKEQIAVVTPFEGEYFGTHVRRGDKHIEDTLIDSVVYVQRLDLMIQADPVLREQKNPNIFVASDDVKVFGEFQALRPHWNVIYVNSTNHNGHTQWAFNQGSREDRLRETVHLLAELEMLKNARQVLCTFSSNVCTLTQIIRTQSPDTVESLDGQKYNFLGRGFVPTHKYDNATVTSK
eukprot:TRINITY_DN1937_c0_g1_i1.p1 TRINITY_DN1937_c0_g1~~TRINITY_DN1937_c0_g1_i1.p1  ORF type:complete len:399 (-),score=81.88 TRINITY_DN1937_c0_g1_i1:24-1175(-)